MLLEDANEARKLDLCTKNDPFLLQVTNTPPKSQELIDGDRVAFEWTGG